MMDFDKRREEIFRRSKKIIEKRRKRNKVMAAFIPFVLTAFVLSITVFPDLFLKKKNSPEGVDSQITSNPSLESSSGFDMLSTPVISVEKYEYSYKKAQAEIDNKEQATQIADLLYSYFDSYKVSTDAQSNSSLRGEGEKAEASSKSSQKKGASSTYYITLYFSNGAEKKYTLKSNTLTSGNEVIKLTSYQASQLRELLNLD